MSAPASHPDSFVCAMCRQRFPWHDEDAALAELARRAPGLTPADCVMVCDACYGVAPAASANGSAA